MICQPDGTMKLEPRRLSSSVNKSNNLIVPKNVSSPLQSKDLPVDSETHKGYLLFSGIPVFNKKESVLFDSSLARDAKSIPEKIVLKKLKVKVKGKTSPVGTGMSLLLYIGDLIVPRVKVSIKDLLQHQGVRPLNIRRMNGELLKIVLIDPDGEWEKNCPEIEVMIV